MNHSRTSLILLAATVAGLGILVGTFLWLKLAPHPQMSGSNAPALGGLNNYGAVPQFTLIERSGRSSTLADMRGKVWIADFIYTTCTDTCPMQSAAMSRLQEKFGAQADLQFVSFTVDPERDTPDVLARYADRFKASADRWLFLTGDKEEIAQLVQEGFRLSAAAVTDPTSNESVILHSPRFVLIDRKNQIRGYYDSRDSTALERLNKDVETLLFAEGIR
ncbi:MAG TPA: SCO family protein [Candidatus Binatia bacterium]|nr:SCO family protein [Candidatus Binatia bacterium]